MDQLRRWREERAAARRRLRLESRPELAQAPPLSRFERRRRKSPSHGIRWWPQPPVVTPVHPEWDDPYGRRLRDGLVLSLVAHALIIPAVLFLPHFHFRSGPPAPGIDRTFAVMIPAALPPVKGQGGRGLRPVQTAPAPAAPKARAMAPRARPQPATAKNSAKSKPRPADTVDPRQSTPEPVADRSTGRPARDSRPNTPALPAINNDVVAGPLLAGRGPVPGSEASIGGVEGVDFPYNYYLELIRTRIAGAWKVPNGVVATGQRIEAQVTFRITRNGSVDESRIENSLGKHRLRSERPGGPCSTAVPIRRCRRPSAASS